MAGRCAAGPEAPSRTGNPPLAGGVPPSVRRGSAAGRASALGDSGLGCGRASGRASGLASPDFAAALVSAAGREGVAFGGLSAAFFAVDRGRRAREVLESPSVFEESSTTLGALAMSAGSCCQRRVRRRSGTASPCVRGLDAEMMRQRGSPRRWAVLIVGEIDRAVGAPRRCEGESGLPYSSP